MKAIATPLADAFLVELDLHEDQRGFFARLACCRDFRKLGLEPSILQINDSLNIHQHTLRGLHYQLPPHAETKLIRCISGSLYDVILDLRPGSATFGQHFGAVLSAKNRRMMFVPRGFAHGYLTLEPMTELFYFVSAYYAPELERGVRWDDPYFAIEWPAQPKVMSDKDRTRPYYSSAAMPHLVAAGR